MSPGEDHGQRRAALIAGHGQPTRFDPGEALRLLGLDGQLTAGQVSAHLYRDEASAAAWLASNAEHYGHAPLGTVTVEGGVVGVLDIRAALARAGAAT